ncbi:MAG: lamin tail domain-containing protein, partial [Candidatus Portnoybacteria bacterium]|nr:lamin tail domain-containing protein [Candidatus Portnoybacteria bacterium]
GTSDYPWEQSMYYNPEETRPINVGYVVEIVGNFWDELFGGDNGLTFQSAGIGGALVNNPVVKEVKNIEVIEKVEVIKEIKEVEVIKEVKEVEKIEKIEEIEEIIVVEEEKIEEEVEEEPAVPSPHPFGFAFPIGGGAQGAAPATGAAPVSVPVVSITSHASGDILGFNQINLIGTSSPDFLVSVSLASTTAATTTADGLGDWNCVLNLLEGENNLAVKAIDAAQNESEDVFLNLIVDTTPPSVVSDLSAVSGVARGTVVLSWTAPSDSIAVSSYIIRYSTSSEITAANWASSTDIIGESLPLSASSTEDLIVSDLTPSETYYWAIKSEDDMGNLSGISNCASSSPSAIAENIVISEISVQNVNRATDEFIELYNPTDKPINLDGWSMRRASSQSTTTWYRIYFNVDGEATSSLPNFNLPSHSYYLLTSATSSDSYSYGMEPDLTAVTADGVPHYLGLASDKGKIKLLNSDNETVDLIAWGEDSLGAEGEPIDIDGFPWGSLERQASASSTAELLAVNGAHHWSGNNIDRDDNSQDFILQTVPNPQNSFSLTEPETTFPVLADTAWPMLQGDIRHSGL